MDLGGYAAIIAGDPDGSELISRITDEDDPMPPGKHGDMLSEEEVRLLTEWIKSGAEYQNTLVIHQTRIHLASNQP